MRYFYRLFIVAQILAMIALSNHMLPSIHAEDAEHMKGCIEREMELRNELQVHLDFYEELLVNRYAPDHVKNWQSVRTERNLLQKKLKELIQRGKFPELKQDTEWVKEHRALQKEFKQVVEKRDEKQLRHLIPLIIKNDDKLNQLNKRRLKEFKHT